MSLLAVGSIAFDDIESPSGRRERILGGSATYFSLSASHFHPIQIVAVVGSDFGPQELAVFKDRPIDISGITREAGLTFHWKGAYGQDLNEARTIDTQLNVFQGFHPVLPETFRSSPYLFLGNIDPVLQLDVVSQMATRPQWVALDTMNFWINGSREALLQVLNKADILLVNETEARSLSGEHNLIKAYKRIQTMGPRVLVIKRGEHGAALFCEEGTFVVPAFPLEDVQDPTGAGDTFAGGFLGHLAASGGTDLKALKLAMIAGSVMASFTVERFGTERLAALEEREITKRMDTFFSMIRVDEL